MPMNYRLVTALEKYAQYYKNGFEVEFPTGSGRMLTLAEASQEISKRIVSLFQKDGNDRRPINDYFEVYKTDPYFKDLILFFEYFHGESGRGVGASHQTGWTGIIAELINRVSLFEQKGMRMIEQEIAV